MSPVMTTVGEHRTWLDRAVETVRQHPVALDAALAVLVAAVSLVWATDGHVARANHGAGLVCAVLFAVPVAWRRRYPLPVAVTVAVAAAVAMLVLPGVSATIVLPVLVIGYSVVVHGPRWAGPVAGVNRPSGILRRKRLSGSSLSMPITES